MESETTLFMWKQQFLKSKQLFISVLPDGSWFNQGYVLDGGSLSLGEPSDSSHSPGESGVLENYLVQKHSEEKAFPTCFPRTSQLLKSCRKRSRERGERLLLPEVPVRGEWRPVCVSHPDFCLEVFSTVARCCWALRFRVSPPARFALSEQWLCWGAEPACAIFNQCSQQVQPVNSWEVWSRLYSAPRQLGYQWVQLCSPCERWRANWQTLPGTSAHDPVR